MERGKSEQPVAEFNWASKVSRRAFLRIEVSAYLVLGLLLAVVAMIGTVSAMFALAKSALELGRLAPTRCYHRPNSAGPDGHRNSSHCRVSFNQGALVCEPFLVVGLIASIRRVLVITLESFAGAGAGTMDARIAGAVQCIDD